MTPAISFSNVSYAYQQAKVLEDITVDIVEEEFFGIIGPNAAGKSTLLKLMLGLLKPDSGEIRVLGKTPAEASRHWLCAAVSFIPA